MLELEKPQVSRASTPDSSSPRRPPLRGRLSRYVLTKSERALLISMCEQCSDGSCIWASIETLAVYSDLSERHIWNLIHGRDRDGRHIPGLLERGILSQLAPAKGWPDPRPATYRINEAALHEKPKVRSRLEARSQMTLPGIRRPSVPGEPVKVASDDADDRWNQVPPHQVEPIANDRWNLLPRQVEPVADDSPAFDSRAFDSASAAENVRAGGKTSVSSSPPQRDDDAGISLARVIEAFEQSPVTTGKAKACDRESARKLLRTFTPDQIEYGILLAGARRVTSFYTLDAAGSEKPQAKVQTFAYFENAILEAATDDNMTASYADYLRHTLRKWVRLKSAGPGASGGVQQNDGELIAPSALEVPADTATSKRDRRIQRDRVVLTESLRRFGGGTR